MRWEPVFACVRRTGPHVFPVLGCARGTVVGCVSHLRHAMGCCFAPTRAQAARSALAPGAEAPEVVHPALPDGHRLMRVIKPIERLVSVSYACRHASTSDLSTLSSTTALIGNTRFQVGFPLRCLQRLSIPYIATLLCGWRHNRSTRDTSIPVLSY